MSKAEASELETSKVKSRALSPFIPSLSFSLSLSMCAEYPLLDRGRFKGLCADLGVPEYTTSADCVASSGSCLSSQSYRGKREARRRFKRDFYRSSSMARRSRNRNVITGALNLFEVHCEVRCDAAEVLMATRDPPIHLAPRSLSPAPSLSATCRMLRRDYGLPFANYEREKTRRENGTDVV